MTLQLLKGLNISLAQQARILRRYERNRHKALARSRHYREQIRSGADAAQLVQHGNRIDEQIEQLGRERADFYWGRVHLTRKLRRWHHLAYNFMRGTPYSKVEQKCWSPPDWEATQEILLVHAVNGDDEDGTQAQVVIQRFAEWRDAAGEWKQPPKRAAMQRKSNWVRQTVDCWVPPGTDFKTGWPDRVRIAAK